MGTDLTTPKGDKNASEGDAAISGATRAAVRKLGQELGIPPDQLPPEDFSFLTKVCCARGAGRVCILVRFVTCAPLSPRGLFSFFVLVGGGGGKRSGPCCACHLYCMRLLFKASEAPIFCV